MSYRKPAFWIVVLSLAACAVAAVCLLANPREKELFAPEPFSHSYRVREILYCAPFFSFTYTPETAPQYCLTADYQLMVKHDVLSEAGDEWVSEGGFAETELTKASFDELLRGADSVSGWADKSYSGRRLRKDNLKAWRAVVPDSENDVFYYLLLQKSGEVILTYGYDAEGDDALIRWVFRLEIMEDAETPAPDDERSYAEISSLFDEICSSPAASSAPGDYIDAHPEEYRELISCGDYTLRYVYSEFLKGGQTGLRGHIMRAAMEELLGDEAIKLAASTGQEYFDAWKEYVEDVAAEQGEAYLRERLPKSYLLLQMPTDRPAT